MVKVGAEKPEAGQGLMRLDQVAQALDILCFRKPATGTLEFLDQESAIEEDGIASRKVHP